MSEINISLHSENFLFLESKLLLISDTLKIYFSNNVLRLISRGEKSYGLSTDFQLSTRTFSSCETVIYQTIIPITAPLMSY